MKPTDVGPSDQPKSCLRFQKARPRSEVILPHYGISTVDNITSHAYTNWLSRDAGSCDSVKFHPESELINYRLTRSGCATTTKRT